MAINPSLQSIIEGLIDRIADAIAARARGGRVAAPGRVAAKPDGRRAGTRLCPVPGCGEAGAGPRNRWFCRDHASSLPVSEQKKLLEQSRMQRSAKAPAGASKSARRGGRRARKLDMSCRVPGCPNLSRGPRFGFICDKHRKELSKAEQKAAREKYNAKKAA